MTYLERYRGEILHFSYHASICTNGIGADLGEFGNLGQEEIGWGIGEREEGGVASVFGQGFAQEGVLTVSPL